MTPPKISKEQVYAAEDEYREAKRIAIELENSLLKIQRAFFEQELAAKGIVPKETICIVRRWGGKIRCVVSPNKSGSISAFYLTKSGEIAKNRNAFNVELESIAQEAAS